MRQVGKSFLGPPIAFDTFTYAYATYVYIHIFQLQIICWVVWKGGNNRIFKDKISSQDCLLAWVYKILLDRVSISKKFNDQDSLASSNGTM